MADETPPTPEPEKKPEPVPTPSEPTPTWLALAKKILPTNWRAFVIWAVIALTTAGINFLRGPQVEPLPIPPAPEPIFPPDGWFAPPDKDTAETLKLPNVFRFSQTEASTLVNDDSDAPLYRFYEKAHGVVMPVRDQKNLGSCVSFGFAGIIELMLAVQQIMKTGPPQIKVPAVVQEVIYGGSRVNINGGRSPISGDGSTGAWAVKWLSTGGVIARGSAGNTDLSSYSVERCREWGDRGVPKEIAELCKSNLVTKYALVESAEEAKKALQQGYPIAVCSNVGFAQTMPISRDSEGFLKPAGSWGHCMYIAGYQGGARPGFLIVNSWGPSWVNGPKGKFTDTPEGSFWADFQAVDRMLKQGDSYSIAGVGGFKRNKINKEDWIIRVNRQPRDLVFGGQNNAVEFFNAP